MCLWPFASKTYGTLQLLGWWRRRWRWRWRYYNLCLRRICVTCGGVVATGGGVLATGAVTDAVVAGGTIAEGLVATLVAGGTGCVSGSAVGPGSGMGRDEVIVGGGGTLVATVRTPIALRSLRPTAR